MAWKNVSEHDRALIDGLLDGIDDAADNAEGVSAYFNALRDAITEEFDHPDRAPAGPPPKACTLSEREREIVKGVVDALDDAIDDLDDNARLAGFFRGISNGVEDKLHLPTDDDDDTTDEFWQIVSQFPTGGCPGETRSGQPCRREAKSKTGYCWQHYQAVLKERREQGGA